MLVYLILDFYSLPTRRLVRIAAHGATLIFEITGRSLERICCNPHLTSASMLRGRNGGFPTCSACKVKRRDRITLRTMRTSNGASALLGFRGIGRRSPRPNVALAAVSLGSPLCPFRIGLFCGTCRRDSLVRR